MKEYEFDVEDDEGDEGRRWRNEEKLGVDCSPYDTIDLYDLTVLFFKKISKG